MAQRTTGLIVLMLVLTFSLTGCGCVPALQEDATEDLTFSLCREEGLRYQFRAENYPENAYYFDWYFPGEEHGFGWENPNDAVYVFDEKLEGQKVTVELRVATETNELLETATREIVVGKDYKTKETKEDSTENVTEDVELDSEATFDWSREGGRKYHFRAKNYSEDAYYFDWYFPGEEYGYGGEDTEITHTFKSKFAGQTVEVKLEILSKQENSLQVITRKVEVQ